VYLSNICFEEKNDNYNEKSYLAFSTAFWPPLGDVVADRRSSLSEFLLTERENGPAGTLICAEP
jgi:hypothetical protein